MLRRLLSLALVLGLLVPALSAPPPPSRRRLLREPRPSAGAPASVDSCPILETGRRHSTRLTGGFPAEAASAICRSAPEVMATCTAAPQQS